MNSEPDPSAKFSAMMMITMMTMQGARVPRLFDFEGGCWWSGPCRNEFQARMVGRINSARQRLSLSSYLQRRLNNSLTTPAPDSCGRTPENNQHG